MKFFLKLSVVYFSFLLSLNAFEATGIVLPKHHLKLPLSIDGKVSKIFVKEGDSIQKGMMILKLEDSLQKLDTKRKKLIYQDRSLVQSMEKNEKLLFEMFKSTKKLYESSKSVSKDELNSLQIRYYEILGQLQSTKQKKLIEQIEYEMSQNILQSHILKAPIDGVVTKINYDIAEWVRGGESIVELVNYKECFVEFNVEQKYSSNLTIGDQLTIQVQSKEGIIDKKSNVVYISAVADESSSLVRVKTKFENNDLSITPGLSATILLKSTTFKKDTKKDLEDGLVPLEITK